MSTILVVDDEKSMRRSVAITLQMAGYKVEEAASGKEAFAHLEKELFDLVITDLVMEEIDGMAVLYKAKELNPATEVIMITAYGTIDSAVAAMKSGAYHYLTKPFKQDELLLLVKKALEHQSLTLTIKHLKGVLGHLYPFKDIVTVNPQMQEVLKKVGAIAGQNVPVLISGESGTGKELIALALHQLSERKDMPFVTLNCGALPESLLESELFGHCRGAFTEAVTHKKGLVEEADGGTLFLDEVGEATASMQVKLLRFLENGEFRRLGENVARRADVRIIAATNKNLQQEIEKGKFRQDLFYRLNVVPIHLPPLRVRKEDIILLTQHFLKRYAEKMNKKVEIIHPAVLTIFNNYSWPGNVRELENAIQYAVSMTETNCIEIKNLPANLQKLGGMPVSVSTGNTMRLEEVEKSHILSVLQRSNWNQRKACKILDISKTTLYRRLKAYNIDPTSLRPET